MLFSRPAKYCPMPLSAWAPCGRPNTSRRPPRRVLRSRLVRSFFRSWWPPRRNTRSLTCRALGVTAVKVSPIGSVGGVTYLNELRGPMPDVSIMPTGGVTLEAAAAYLDAGAVAVGVSGALLEDALLGGDLVALNARAQQLVSSVSGS